jgi:hypothetical protein
MIHALFDIVSAALKARPTSRSPEDDAVIEPGIAAQRRPDTDRTKNPRRRRDADEIRFPCVATFTQPLQNEEWALLF